MGGGWSCGPTDGGSRSPAATPLWRPTTGPGTQDHGGPDRSPAAAASAIAQRLLPRYARALIQVRASLAKQAADQARRAQFADRLARTLHGEISSETPDHTRVRWSVSRLTGTPATGWGDIELLEDASTARLQADRVPIAVVERFVAALASLAIDPPAGRREQLRMINDVVWADYYPPGSPIRHRLTIPRAEFDALAKEREMDSVLRVALLTARLRRALDPQPGRHGAENRPRHR